MHLSYDGRLAAAHLLCATASAMARSALSGQNRKLFGVRRESDGASQYPLFAPQASLVAPCSLRKRRSSAPCSLRKRRSSPLVRSASVAHRPLFAPQASLIAPLFAPQASLIAPCSLRKRRSSPLVRSASVAHRPALLFAPPASPFCALVRSASVALCPLFAPQASLRQPEESNTAVVFATVFVTAANAARRRLSPADPGRTSDPDH